MRKEKDCLGERDVPDEAWYGIHTARSLENFKVSGTRMPVEIIHGIVKLKWAAARANTAVGVLAREKRDAIVQACQRVLSGAMDDQFPIDVFQAGSGTSTNMNVNEVLANLANESLGGRKGDRGLVHPNDDVNLSQSTNNIFPSAIKIAAVELSGRLLGALRRLIATLRQKEEAFADVFKTGRTHLQDAVPITLGQEFGAWARALEKDLKRIDHARQKAHELGAGGTAVGTGLNTKKEFRPALIRELCALTGAVYEGALNGVENTQFLTDLAELSGALRLLALDLQKIANDLRLLASGPRTGFNEIVLPPVEPGSSIMPGKINPSICEALNMVCIQAQGHDHAVALACGAGQLELNTHMPVLGFNLVAALKILERGCAMFEEKCVAGIQANREVCRRYFETSAGLPTLLNPRLGYDRVAELVKESIRTNKSLRQLVLEKQLLSEAEFNQLLESSIGPNL